MTEYCIFIINLNWCYRMVISVSVRARAEVWARALLSNSGICSVCKVSLHRSHAHCGHCGQRDENQCILFRQQTDRQVPSTAQLNSEKKSQWQQLSGQWKPVSFFPFCDIWMASALVHQLQAEFVRVRYGSYGQWSDQSKVRNERNTFLHFAFIVNFIIIASSYELTYVHRHQRQLTIQLTLDFVSRHEALTNETRSVWKRVKKCSWIGANRVPFNLQYVLAIRDKAFMCRTFNEGYAVHNTWWSTSDDERREEEEKKKQYHARIDFIWDVSQYRTKCSRKMHFYGIVSPCAWPLWWIYSFRRRQPRAFVIESEGSLSAAV